MDKSCLIDPLTKKNVIYRDSLILSARISNRLFCSKNVHQLSIGRRSRRWCSVEKDVLKNFAKFTGKHLCRSLFLN